MFRNYLTIAFRNLSRNKGFSAITILGLAMGLAACILIGLYVVDELSYDRYNEKADQIVRVVFRGTVKGGKINEAHVMPPVAKALKIDYPEVLAATRLRHGGSPSITVGDKIYSGDALVFADSNFFQVFTLPFLKGNARTALDEPNNMVISERLAEKYFGNQDPIGKTVECKGWNSTYTITGVIRNVPENSHFHFDLFTSMTGLQEAKSTSWMVSEFFTYLVLPKGYDYKLLEAKLPQTVDKYIGPQLKQAMGMTIAEFRKNGNDLGLYLQPLTDIHLHSDMAYDLGNNGNMRYVYIFGAVGIFMLLIACINYMNLSTAAGSKRAREVGVRKVMGSRREELIIQFLTESGLTTALSLVLAIAIAFFALPLFNNLSGKNLTFQLISRSLSMPVLLVLGMIVGVLAGGYPAFFLSSYTPATILKGKLTSLRRSMGLRSGLVVVQFFISVVLMIGTGVVYQQLDYIQSKELGYNKDQVLILQDTWALGKNQAVFQEELLRDPQVVHVSSSGYLPAGSSYNNNFTVYPDNENTQLVKTLRYDVDYDYLATLGLTLREGRNFAKEFGTDSTAVIVNETAATLFGWKKDVVNHTITNANNEGGKTTYRIIGVVKDFHFRSMHERIAPLVMVLGKGAGTTIVKIKTEDVRRLLERIKSSWDAFKPEMPFSYSFLDERFNATYEAEQKTGQILGVFAGLTIFVACMGLFGLATFMAEQRVKEIGVRKVLGASVVSVAVLLSREFLSLVVVAIALATPFAWYGMDRWLQDFEYRTTIAWPMVLLIGGVAIVVALLTVSYQAVKAALMNPVKSLRSE